MISGIPLVKFRIRQLTGPVNLALRSTEESKFIRVVVYMYKRCNCSFINKLHSLDYININLNLVQYYCYAYRA